MQEVQNAIVYCGSFDPPHLGHLHALLAAMLKYNADRAVVWAIDGKSRIKPKRLTWHLRVEMLRELFVPFHKIYVANTWENLEITIDRARVISLVGSDVWNDAHGFMPTSYFDELCVSIREDEIPIVADFPLPVTYVYPPLNKGSSSSIRKALKKPKDPENQKVLETYLTKRVRTYIENKGLY